ncbi:PREDICTED: basic form of pathogenesis-related protein 1-like [Prunus mume]|uniref:Basic form of pathogenesis-related protein 1-like n=1 Tax=Prunus mume TaxID=102107 RepID=A0ABM0PX73_PRUMU|nr:PREDICTED: basic form of pathogenesis-related protein 1-like [Prunus mume]XP_008245994.1 PREDICTED: basic form of pathogenesis-related protein 1-like [Prunus mume]
MVHSQGPYGENLAEGYGEMTGGQAMKFWVTEKPNYDYASNTCVGDVCGHYTQVVWRNSTHVGCARAKCKNGWMFVICGMAMGRIGDGYAIPISIPVFIPVIF